MRLAGLALVVLAIAVPLFLGGCATAPSAPEVEKREVAVLGLVTTQRSVPLRYSPTFSAPVIAIVPAETGLYWLDNQQRNGFYRVAIKGKGGGGWVRAADVRVVQNRILTGFESFATCASSLDQCEERGCAAEHSPGALSNILKHHVPKGSTGAAVLSFDDFAGLQQQADEVVGAGAYISVDDRRSLANLTVAGGSVSEGDAVRLVGYLAGEGTGPHPNSSGESVNCGLKGVANNDFHIPVVADPAGSEFEAIVVEMIPQGRPDNWTIKNLRAAQRAGRQVLVEGSLFYDSAHRVNADADNPLNGQPKRFSLWEVHPVTKFLVCKKEVCDPNDANEWTAL